jgi:hypothetical protein
LFVLFQVRRTTSVGFYFLHLFIISFRRILAIAPHPQWSTANEILTQNSVHNKYIIQMRVILSLIPGIFSDLKRNYHDDWLIDVISIVYQIVQ